MEQMSRGFRRPMSTPAVTVGESADGAEIDRWVLAKTLSLITSFCSMSEMFLNVAGKRRDMSCGKLAYSVGLHCLTSGMLVHQR